MEEKGAHAPPAERCSRLRVITRRGSGSLAWPFPKQSSLSCSPFPAANNRFPSVAAVTYSVAAVTYSVAVRTYSVALGPHTARLRSWDTQESLATGVTAAFHPVGLVEGRQGGEKINTHYPVRARRWARGQPPGTKVLRQNTASGSTPHKHCCRDGIPYSSLKPATDRSPQTSNLRQSSRAR